MKWTEIQTGKTHGAFQHFMVALGDKAEVAVDRMNDQSDAFVKRLAAYAIKGGIEPTVSQQKAREIMGHNMFGIEEAIHCFGINPSYGQLAVLSEIPFTKDKLKQCKDTHILVAVFPLSILEIREKVQDKGLFYNQNWYEKETFAKEQGQTNWELVRKTPVPNSTSQTWEDQQKLLSKDEQVPTAQIMVYTIIGHYLTAKERLFEYIYVRTFSLDSDGHRGDVGDFDSDGLGLDNYWDSYCGSDLALASLSQKS